MALQVWLPLTKDLRQQGLSTTTVTSNTATYSSTGGKLGGYYTKSLTVSSPNIATTLSGYEFSVCFWIYINELPTEANLADTYVMYAGTAATRQQFHIAIRAESQGSAFAFCFYGDDYSFYNTVSDKLNQWMHVACLFKNNTQIVYVNGEKIGEREVTDKMSIAANSPLVVQNPHNRLNDLRIYDNCLTTEEVKKIAQGLVLHYPLNGQGFGNENILMNTHFDATSTVSAWDTTKNGTLQAQSWGGYNSGVTNAATVYHAHLKLFNHEYVYDYTKTNAENWLGIAQSGLQTKLIPGETYTFSWEEYHTSGTNRVGTGLYYYQPGASSANFHLGIQQASNVVRENNKWQTFSYTFVAPTNADYTKNISWYIYGHYNGNGTFYMRHPKLERGSAATPWTPYLATAATSNLLKLTAKSANTTTYNCYQFDLTQNLVAGKTYTLQLWNVNVSHSAKTAEQLGIWFYWGGGNVVLGSWYGPTYFTNGHADYLSKTFTVTSEQAAGNGATNAWLNMYNSVGYVEGTMSCTIGKWKLEEGNIATPYNTNAADICGLTNNIEYDTSGFEYDGTKVGRLTYQVNGPKYQINTKFPNLCNTYIFNTEVPKLTKDLTFACWCKVLPRNNTYSFIVSQGRDNTASGFNLALLDSAFILRGSFGTVDSNIATNNTWTHVVGTYDGTAIKIYINGELKNSLAYTSDLTYTDGPAFVVGKMAYNYTSSIYYFPTNGNISDVRVYATALSAEDILDLYNSTSFHASLSTSSNLWAAANQGIINKTFTGGLNAYTQSNCQITLTDDGYRIYRPPNVTYNSNDSSTRTMWGGFLYRNPKPLLLKGHTYMIKMDIKGQTSNGSESYWSNEAGWSGGAYGLGTEYTWIENGNLPVDWSSSDYVTRTWRFIVTGNTYKECTTSYSSFYAGIVYPVFRDFKFGFNYANTGTLGTDLYIKNIRLYDITYETDLSKFQ